MPLAALLLTAGAAADRSDRLRAAMALMDAGRNAEAAQLLRPLAAEGSAVAETKLGMIAAKSDPAVATTHYFRAAQKGYPPAQLMFAQALAAGSGTPVNTREALRWALVAAAQGQTVVREKAQAFAAKLSARMDPATVERIRERAAAWRPWDAMPG